MGRLNCLSGSCGIGGAVIPPTETEVFTVCDEFEKTKGIEAALQITHDARFTGTVRFGNSEQDKPLQLADLVAGTVRRSLIEEFNEGRFGILVPLLFHVGAVTVRQK